MSIAGLGMMGGPANGLRFNSTRGRMQNGAGTGVNYPSPFFDVAHTYLPTTVKQMFRWCRYYFMTHPLINAVAFKLSEYPITDLIIEHEDKEVARRWEGILQDDLRYRPFQVEVGLDYHVYGNAFVSLSFPFNKILTCQSCKHAEQAKKCRNQWVFTNYAFRLACPKCGTTGDAMVKDQYIKDVSGVKLLRWNAEDMEILHNDLTGEATYFYTIPSSTRNDIVMGRKEIVEGVPQIFIQALKEQKGVVLSKDSLFHLKRPTLATQDRGWGMPLLLPVLKDAYYLQLMKKAQEAILLEHILPLRVIFPQPASGTADPFSLINLQDWRDHVAAEIARWRMDPPYIPILPLPIGNQTIGGDGKALLMTAEIREWSEQLCAGMQVPREFIFGGLSYSGSSVSMRMLENAFIGYTIMHKQLLRFIMRQIANFMDWPIAKARFKPFKMADDIQRKAFRLQLNTAGKISDRTLLSDDDLDSTTEDEIIKVEEKSRMEAVKAQQLATAGIQGEAQLIMAKYQAKVQQVTMQAAQGAAPGEPGGHDAALENGGGVPGGQEATAPGGGAQEAQAAPQGAAGAQMADPNFGKVDPGQAFDATIGSSLGLQNRGGGADLRSLAMMQAKTLITMDPMQQQLAIQNLKGQDPNLCNLVLEYLAELEKQKSVQEQQAKGNGKGGGGANGVDMRPMPEQRPERRNRPNV